MRNYTDQLKFGLVVLIVASLIVMANECMGQVDSVLTYDMTQNISTVSKIRDYTSFKYYLSRDGSVIKKGFPLTIGRATRYGEFKYIAGAWVISHINVNMDTYDRLTMDFQGEQVIVSDIVVWHSKTLNKKSPLEVYLRIVNPKLILKNRTVINYEMALSEGEIINPWTTLSRDQAIEKMKDTKALLDMGIITQAKYDSISGALASKIKEN